MSGLVYGEGAAGGKALFAFNVAGDPTRPVILKMAVT